MKYLLTGKEMKLWEKKMMEKYKVPSVLLMERAALAVCDELSLECYDKHRVLIVCGYGNNGGDGLAMARILKGRGIRVDVCMDDSQKSQSEENRLQMEMYLAMGGSFVTQPKWNEYTVIVDAILGIGCNREVTGNTANLIKEMNDTPAKVISVDIPSGISADTGKVCKIAVKADATVTFFTKKLGMILYPGRVFCGKIVVNPLDLPFEATSECRIYTYGREALKKLPYRKPDAHKGTFGKVLVIAGCRDICGAAYLAAAGSYAIGSGLVKIYTAAENKTALQTLLPEALLTVYDSNAWNGHELRNAIKWADVLVIGPGLGQNDLSEQILQVTFETAGVPLVIDADAINLLKDNMEKVYSYGNDMVLTPHILEFARLTGNEKQEILDDAIGAADDFTKRCPVTLVLKNARTVVAKNGEKIYLNTSGNSGMSVGGSGDVLAGIIGGLIAQGMETAEAARTGVYIHGKAGDCAACKKGSYSMLASDLLDGIAEVTKNETI